MNVDVVSKMKKSEKRRVFQKDMVGGQLPPTLMCLDGKARSSVLS